MNYPEVLMEIRPSQLEGVGVFALRNLKAGQKIIIQEEKEFDDQIPWSEFEKLDDKQKQMVFSFAIGTSDGFVAPENLNFNKLSGNWFLNHSCNGNVGFDEQGNFIAIKDIKKDEELVYDYALLESNPNFKMNCQCRSANCRHVITGNDWKSGVVGQKYMTPHLKKQLS